MNANSSTTSNWLKLATAELEKNGINTARLDALVMLEDVIGKNRAHLLAHPELELTTEQEKTLESFLNRRLQHEPLAYIRGKAEFYGRDFSVNEHVLVPRPESEDIITLLKEYRDVTTIIDIGTGSGALAITAALEFPRAEVIGIDVDPECLKVAKANAKQLDAHVAFLEGDLLRREDLEMYQSPVFILANLPYVPDDYAINEAAKHEPTLALFAGRDGLELYRVMFDQLTEYEDTEIIVLTESLESQHKSLAGIAVDHGFTLGKTAGLIQSFTYLP